MRPVFCGNFEYDTRQSDLERLFRKYGKVDRVDMKSGFAFVYMEDERDGDDAIRALDRLEFGRKGRRLRVEWSKEERGRRPETKRSTSGRVSKTLFVINFDPYNTRTRDLERHFEPHGKILNIRIRRNFAFIQFETQEDATKALDATNLSKLMDRVITVEYAIKDDDDRRNGNSPDRSRGRSPRRGGYDRERSRSPYGRERASPDYGRGRERLSPDYGRGPSPNPRKERNAPSPDYARGYGRSPSPFRREGVTRGPNHKGREIELSPIPHRRERLSPDYVRGIGDNPSPFRREGVRRGPSHKEREIELSPSPHRRKRVSPDYARGIGDGLIPFRQERHSSNHKGRDGRSRSRSPNARKERNSGNVSGHSSLSPPREKPAPENGQHANSHSPSPQRERRVKSSPEMVDGPEYGGESPPQRDRSRSASSRERSRS